MEADGQSLPTWAQTTLSGESTWTWAASSTDIRALQKAASSTDRIAATWFNGGPFTLDVNLTDGQPHNLSVYALDWDSTSRAERLDVLDPTTGTLLDSRSISRFNGGTYLIWTVTGHVQIRVTWTAGANAVLSALFLN